MESSFQLPGLRRSALPNVQRGRRKRKERDNELSCLHNGGVGELGGSWVGAMMNTASLEGIWKRMDGGKVDTKLEKFLNMF